MRGRGAVTARARGERPGGVEVGRGGRRALRALGRRSGPETVLTPVLRPHVEGRVLLKIRQKIAFGEGRTP